MDILLDNNGDLFLRKDGDIILSNSVRQKIRIKLLWFLGEWRWNKDYGLPYFEELLIKNPDTEAFERYIHDVLVEIEEVTEISKVEIAVDPATRIGAIAVTVKASVETIREEVRING
ncbi:GPW/gp25 family protein [Enterocloster bolteae]|uniref:GPW/gp25 family protein n=1 Tax=Enterocloster bolteae TaxID=208479 RepID=UPI002A83FBBB|nr:GPW/gp25 family protein [Enterocloster bolteae]